jgi:hypothetical protein
MGLARRIEAKTDNLTAVVDGLAISRFQPEALGICVLRSTISPPLTGRHVRPSLAAARQQRQRNCSVWNPNGFLNRVKVRLHSVHRFRF